jgi:putative membrane protein
MKTNYLNSRVTLSCLALLVGQLALVSSQAADPNDNKGQFSSSDYKFAKTAAAGGMTEVNLGKIASEKSGNPAIQQFGQQMVTDHGKAGQQLQQIATSKGATLPTAPTAAQQKEIDRLTQMSGTDFDKAYVALMVKDHKADQKEFKKASENAQDPELKAFATATLSIVQDHLKMVEDLDQTLKHNSLTMNQ